MDMGRFRTTPPLTTIRACGILAENMGLIFQMTNNKEMIKCGLPAVMVGVLLAANAAFGGAWVRVNQAGYMPDALKCAVMIATEDAPLPDEFAVCRADNNEVVHRGATASADASRWQLKQAARLDFSAVRSDGEYYVRCGETTSTQFRIGSDVYAGAADFLLNYMRQQRCGDNPYTGELCHQHDGFVVDYATSAGQRLDVRGGWHDATDYLQYTPTSATALTHLMFAWSEAKDRSVFADAFDARGRAGANGTADLLDEIRYGLDWLLRMNPHDGVMFNQIADDRDHSGMRLPQDDRVDYGYGPGTGRPVYFVTGTPQRAKNALNRTSGVSSTAGKFAAAFALGAKIFGDSDAEFAKALERKAQAALEFGEAKPGNTQTVCVISPYFYEEDNFADDMELGYALMWHAKSTHTALRMADKWGAKEPVSPWIFQQEKTRHYQYYPFINLGHHYLASNTADADVAAKYRGYMHDGLAQLRERGANDPFLNGVPFVWCSNNLVSAAVTQARLYRRTTGDTQFLQMESALRDWLFGCNPWGTSMVVGWPKGAVSPTQPHSSYVHKGGTAPGGLVDGPVYRTVFEQRAGRSLTTSDTLAIFNHGIAVYHDDIGDYASNEPTMDGTAGLVFVVNSE